MLEPTRALFDAARLLEQDTPVAPLPANIITARRQTLTKSLKTGLEQATTASTVTAAHHKATGGVDKTGAIIDKPKSDELPKTGKVVSVYDGDTLTLDPDKKVRVMNVNCPEKRPLEEFAMEARDFTMSLVLDKTVSLTYRGDRNRDDYGRLLAEISVGKKDLSEELLRKGLGHLFLVADGVPPEVAKRLLAAQEEAKAAKRGIWSTERFQKPVHISAFHANGRGDDEDDPNAEYFRLVNITAEPMQLGDYSVSNAAGAKWQLPDMVIPPGHSVKVYSGVKDEVLYPGDDNVFLGNEEPIWNNKGDTLTLARKGEVMIERSYVGKSIDPTTLPDPVSQARLRRLGSDADVVWKTPKSIRVEDYEVDDGDTLYFPSPKDGLFKVTVEGVERKVTIADQKQTPEGMLAVRFMGVDTPETHIPVKGPDGEEVIHDQGELAFSAKRALARILGKATRVLVEPDPTRPFDAYDRMLGQVVAVMPDGKKVLVNEWLVENGHGEMNAYYPGEHFDEVGFQRLRAASRKAVEGHKGIYGDPGLEERPSDFRRRVQGKPAARGFVADYESKLVYPIAEIDKVAPYNRIFIPPSKLRTACADLGLSMAPSQTQAA